MSGPQSQYTVEAGRLDDLQAVARGMRAFGHALMLSDPLGVPERVFAKEIGMSVTWLRRDRRGASIFPFIRVGKAVRYNMDRCREALAAMEEGGPKKAAQ